MPRRCSGAAWDRRRASGLLLRRFGQRGRGRGGGRVGDGRLEGGRGSTQTRTRGRAKAVSICRVTALPAGFGMNRIRIHVLPTNRGRITPVPRSQEPLSCSFTHRPCSQPRLEGQEFCIKHILEDKNAPFKQCSYVSTKNGKRCPSAAPKPEKKDGYVERRGLVIWVPSGSESRYYFSMHAKHRLYHRACFNAQTSYR